MSTPRKFFHSRGFTVLELLVVIAVIAILAAFLFPALSSSMAMGRTTQCAASLSQIGKAWVLTVNDSPISTLGSTGFSLPRVQKANGDTWVDTVLPAAGDDRELFRCPAQENTTSGVNNYGYGMNPLAGASFYYQGGGSGYFGGGFLLTPDDPRTRDIGQIKNPSKTLIIADNAYITDASKDGAAKLWQVESSKPWRPYLAFALTDTTSALAVGMGGGPNYGYDWGNTAPQTGIGSMGWDEHYRACGRHRQKCNSLFIDGHVKSLTIDSLVSPEWSSPECLFDNR